MRGSAKPFPDRKYGPCENELNRANASKYQREEPEVKKSINCCVPWIFLAIENVYSIAEFEGRGVAAD
jgi:hypothetical protein